MPPGHMLVFQDAMHIIESTTLTTHPPHPFSFCGLIAPFRGLLPPLFPTRPLPLLGLIGYELPLRCELHLLLVPSLPLLLLLLGPSRYVNPGLKPKPISNPFSLGCHPLPFLSLSTSFNLASGNASAVGVSPARLLAAPAPAPL